MPVCTECSFVIYSNIVDPNELSRCRIYVRSPEYEKITNRASNHRLGRLFEHLGKTHYDTAMAFLVASWQEEANKKYCAENRDNCLSLLKKHLAECESKVKPDPNEVTDANDIRENRLRWHTAQLLVGELLRLKGQFQKAANHFEALLETEGFLLEKYGDLVRFELTLCKNKDSEHHFCDEQQRKRRRRN